MWRNGRPRWLYALLILVWGLSAPLLTRAAGLEDALAGLKESSFVKKREAVVILSTLDEARPVLQALMDARLYLRKDNRQLVIVEQQGGGFIATDPLTGNKAGVADKGGFSKIILNNSLRTQLRTALARLNLTVPDPAVRLGAVQELIATPNLESVALLRIAQGKETDATVREEIAVALALADLDASDTPTRLAALETLSDSLKSEVRNRLATLVEQDTDAAVQAQAQKALSRIDARLQRYRLLETGFFGLGLGAVLALAAIGLAITFGVMGVINMAHGELMMLGAYTTYVVQLLMPNHIAASLFVAIPAAFLVAGLVGVAIERGVIRFLYGRPLETLLATFGISLFLQQLVRSIFSPLNRSVITPEWMSGSLQVNGALSLTYNRLYIVLFTLLVFVALLLVLKRTALGLQLRAVSQNRAMARAMGIRSGFVDAATFGLGSGIAGIAGVALSQLTNVGPNLGQAYIVDSFLVVVFGGVGNLWGTLVGGLTLGVANKFLEPMTGAVLAKIIVLVLIIVFIQKRPRGLFPQKGRAAET